jgi:hypothetical protein
MKPVVPVRAISGEVIGQPRSREEGGLLGSRSIYMESALVFIFDAFSPVNRIHFT